MGASPIPTEKRIYRKEYTLNVTRMSRYTVSLSRYDYRARVPRVLCGTLVSEIVCKGKALYAFAYSISCTNPPISLIDCPGFIRCVRMWQWNG